MCGIASYVDSDGSPPDEALASARADLLAHRGPDGTDLLWSTRRLQGVETRSSSKRWPGDVPRWPRTRPSTTCCPVYRWSCRSRRPTIGSLPPESSLVPAYPLGPGLRWRSSFAAGSRLPTPSMAGRMLSSVRCASEYRSERPRAPGGSVWQRLTYARHGLLVTEIDSLAGEVLDTQPLAREPHGFAWRVDAQTGDVLQTEIECKFVGLFLKLPILHELVVRQGRHPFADADVRRLATDR
jgi:hypothetical protein